MPATGVRVPLGVVCHIHRARAFLEYASLGVVFCTVLIMGSLISRNARQLDRRSAMFLSSQQNPDAPIAVIGLAGSEASRCH